VVSVSYDINFWKQSKPLEATPEEIYHKLCQGERVDGLEDLPTARILERIRAAFPECDDDQENPYIRMENCGVEVSWSDQHFRFDIRGEQCARVNELAAILRDFGCPMYDPQVNQRYDANGGMVPTDWPPFEDWTDDERQTFERQREILLAAIGEKTPKRGCRSAAVFLMAVAAGLAWLCVRALLAA
jgi:hypothetical protein